MTWYGEEGKKEFSGGKYLPKKIDLLYVTCAVADKQEATGATPKTGLALVNKPSRGPL